MDHFLSSNNSDGFNQKKHGQVKLLKNSRLYPTTDHHYLFLLLLWVVYLGSLKFNDASGKLQSIREGGLEKMMRDLSCAAAF